MARELLKMYAKPHKQRSNFCKSPCSTHTFEWRCVQCLTQTGHQYIRLHQFSQIITGINELTSSCSSVGWFFRWFSIDAGVCLPLPKACIILHHFEAFRGCRWFVLGCSVYMRGTYLYLFSFSVSFMLLALSRRE